MAGKDTRRKLADFDRHYMPDGVPEPEASVKGTTGEHRSNLKRKAKGIARSLAEVFAYPVLPDDRSDFDVHGALEDDKVKQFECSK